ncbi:MAG: hypothetical protein FJX20_20120 [Alphaproteobacteria bacterium]|nr:hypothetical protein [Alphaproteobacteria bacterium]
MSDDSQSSGSSSGSDSGSDDGSSFNPGFGDGSESVSDSFTETSHTSWFERMKQAIVGVVAGLVMVAGSIGLLFWNEGRAVTTSRSLSEGAAAVVSAQPARVDPAHEGKLVHVAGDLKLAGPVADPEFGVSATVIKLVRKVEMYQWKEESRQEKRTNVGGSQETVTTYTYVREWSEKRNDSSRFKQPGGHGNPEMRYQSRANVAPSASLGAFQLTAETLGQVSGGERLPVDQARLQQLRQRLGNNVHLRDGTIYVGVDPDSPRIGDLRISFEQVTAEQLTVIARQAGSGFGRYQTKAGDQLLIVAKGVVPAAQLFSQAQAANSTLTWILRGVGAVLMFVGFGLFFRPLGVLGDVLPILGDVIRMGTGVIAFVLTLLLATTTIAIAWVYHRPLVGIAVLVVGVGGTIGMIMLAKKRRAARMAGAPVPARAAARPVGPVS